MKLEVCLHESLTEDSEWQYGLIITHWSQGTTKLQITSTMQVLV
jgi:hypothetical protein